MAFSSAVLKRLRGEGARRAAQGELVNYLRARGVAGAETEIIATVQERLAQVESAMASPLAEAWATAADWFPSLDFRPAVRNVTSVLRPGPERQEVKLRYRWRKRADSCRPQTLKGGAHRRGGAKRRGPERAVGHNGGAMARAMRAEESRDALKAAQQAKRIAKRARMVTAARRKEGGASEPSHSAVAASARVDPTNTLSAFMKRIKESANGMFTF